MTSPAQPNMQQRLRDAEKDVRNETSDHTFTPRPIGPEGVGADGGNCAHPRPGLAERGHLCQRKESEHIMTSRMSHTPGPWTGWYTPNGPEEHAWAIGPVGCVPCVATVSADVAGDLTDGAIIQANARLIAAAPELLAAAKKLVECYLNPAVADQHEDCWATLETAIAKAEVVRP